MIKMKKLIPIVLAAFAALSSPAKAEPTLCEVLAPHLDKTYALQEKDRMGMFMYRHETGLVTINRAYDIDGLQVTEQYPALPVRQQEAKNVRFLLLQNFYKML